VQCGEDNRAGVTRANNAVVRNSTVYNTGGDGILVMQTNNSTIENNVVHDTGQSSNIGALNSPGWTWTPNGMWTWNCDGCVMQGNEVYNASSWNAVDGGGLDIDTLSQNTIAQYNYAHDNKGYCISVFGAYGVATTNSTVRYNTCARNGNGGTQGDIALVTWQNGSLDGVKIYNNTTYYASTGADAAFFNTATFSGTNPNFYRNNVVYSDVPKLTNSNSSMSFDNNLYHYTGTGSPTWRYAGTTHTGWNAYRSGTSQDRNGLFEDPRMSTPTYNDNGRPFSQFTLNSDSRAVDAGATISGNGGRDFYGNTVPRGRATDIGAHESGHRNAVANGGFETGTASVPDSWITTAAAGYRDTTGSPPVGSWKGTHYAGSAYEVLTSQTVTGLSGGRTYTLRASAASSGGQTSAGMGVKSCGDGVDHYQDLRAIGSSFTSRQLTLTVPIGSTSCQVYFYSKAGATQYLVFDAVSLS
jgi:hypothetical protein